MSVSWIYKIDAPELGIRNEPLRYHFTYTVGTETTCVELATNQYNWEGERADEVSGILLEPVMPIQLNEPFMASENDAWKDMCVYWMRRQHDKQGN